MKRFAIMTLSQMTDLENDLEETIEDIQTITAELDTLGDKVREIRRRLQTATTEDL